MPGGFASLNLSFPDLSQQDSTEKKVAEMANYLFQLQEQLRYVMYNLGAENFNQEGLKELGGIISEQQQIQKNIADLRDIVSIISDNVDSAMGTAVEAKSDVVKIWQSLAPIETGSQATHAYQTGDLLVNLGYLYKAVAAIQIGDTFMPSGSRKNIERTSLDEIIKAIAGSQT